MKSLYERVIDAMSAEARRGALPSHLLTCSLTPETRLAELGIDSMGRMTLISVLMDLTDNYIADDAFKDECTLAEVVDIAFAPSARHGSPSKAMP